jgi:choline-glycine betaine transporter
MSRLPRLMQVGLAVVALGGGADVLHHALPLTAAPVLAPYLGHEGGVGHAVTLAGMVVTMLGVVTAASKQRTT